jgi:hypothetical protein
MTKADRGQPSQPAHTLGRFPQLRLASRSLLPDPGLHGFSGSFLIKLSIVVKMFDALVQDREAHNFPVTAFIPWTTRIGFALIANASRVVEILID